ncbi:hypothetical protein [Donghicola mangrovi]|uniref:Uncharacterized protein n=1 Tax=Donghicola mangrovi TaxID=2729614 RepID=A0A850Q8C7_9RHOB|nr:hypothetical protein [Donghicola mangrovi]NVO25406.1 hypothetical protein [Donghicola mangrovi]
MTSTTPQDPHLLSRIETLIDLLRQMLDREGHPLADRLDQFLIDISQIERAMTSAAENLTQAVPKLAEAPSRSDLALVEDRIGTLLDEVIYRQVRLDAQLDLLFQPVGAEADG